MIRLVLAAALAAVTAADCGTENELPKTAPPPFEWASLDGSSSAAAPSATSGGSAIDPGDLRVVALKKLDVTLAGNDPKAYAELFATDASVVIPGISEWKGREDVAALHTKIFHAFDDVKVGASRVWVKRDFAAVEWTLVGTHARTWLGVNATSKPVAMQGLSVYTFDADGRVKTARVHFDVVAVLVQLGAAVPSLEAGPKPTLPTTTDVVIAQGSPEEDANAAANDAAGKALEQGNVDLFLAPLADDVEHLRNSGPPTKGRDAERKAFETITKAMTDRKVKVESWGVKSFVIDEFTIAAVNSGSLAHAAGAAPTKKPVTWRGATVIEVKDKKVVRLWTYVNRAELLSQLGVKIMR
jgi:uncharacterized protein (TIGR02246 family)